MIGTAIANYEIVREIGRGGMGIVYLARDTKLDRDVAIKVLPEDVAGDHDRLARFEREAKLLATLHHSNVAAVYGLEEVDGVRYLVLEYVEGEDLAEILVHGPLSVDDTLPIARQITEAVEAAHAKGVVHRDLKPANVKITSDGTAKVLDFGLAKALHEEATTASGLVTSPTFINLTSPTNAAVILGTAGYISPEQARGKNVDRRTDIWSFGCILFEMLSGEKVFGGETASDSLGAVMHKEPQWSALPPDTPPTVLLLLRRCLAKDRKRRLQDIGDARIELEEAIADPTGSSLNLAAAALATRDRRPWHAAAPWLLMCLLPAALVAAWFVWRTPLQPGPIRKLTLTIDAEQAIPVFAVGPFAISPDASRVVFVGPGTPFTSLYLRSLDQVEAMPLPNTDGARRPFFSPDGQWIAYEDDDRLMRISVRGGPPNTLCDAPAFRGGSWGEDGTIVFTPERTGGLFRVLAAGGTPEPLTTVPDDGVSHRNASLLPDGRGVLFTASGNTNDWEKVAVWVYSNETGEQKELIRGGTDGRYVPTGHLVYRRESTLMAATFDLDTLDVTGPSVPVLEGVAGGSTWYPAQFTFAQDGTAVYMPGTGSVERSLVWTDLQGRNEPLSDRTGEFRAAALSPNDDRVAISVQEDTNSDIWILERQRDILRPLTFDLADDDNPVWSPDGRWIVFSSDRDNDGASSLYRIAADFTGTPQRLTTAEFTHVPFSIAPDGGMIAYMEVHPDSDGDLYFLHVDEEGVVGEPEPLAKGPTWQWAPSFSPDGRWVAFCSAQSGRAETYVRAVSGGAAPVQVSTDGGFRVAWSPTEDRLFYTHRGEMFAVRYTIDGQTMTPGLPETLFTDEAGGRGFSGFDVSADGLRFSRIRSTDDDGEREQPVVILNWFKELADKVPSTD